jgi:hypothetical protein
MHSSVIMIAITRQILSLNLCRNLIDNSIIMTLKQRADAFIELGKQMKAVFAEEIHTLSPQQQDLKAVIEQVCSSNPWFIPEFSRHAVRSISEMLNADSLNRWLLEESTISPDEPLKRIGVVMAGNIPAVGFHDFLCVLISGNLIQVKLSSDDHLLIPAIARLLIAIEPQFETRIQFVSGKLEQIDAVIATGSNNTSRYFEYYFGKYPSIIRKSRSSIAVLSGNETTEELSGLLDDLFLYFGLGCRNVTKLYVPAGYDFIPLLDLSNSKADLLLSHNKYYNNYEYNKAVFLVNGTQHLDTGYLLVKEDTALHSPIGVIHYETYTSVNEVINTLASIDETLQCVVSKIEGISSAVRFGKSQQPALNEYADHVNTLNFLIQLQGLIPKL